MESSPGVVDLLLWSSKSTGTTLLQKIVCLFQKPPSMEIVHMEAGTKIAIQASSY